MARPTIGLVAADSSSGVGLGRRDLCLREVEQCRVALADIQALDQRVATLTKQLDSRDTRIQQLEREQVDQ